MNPSRLPAASLYGPLWTEYIRADSSITLARYEYSYKIMSTVHVPPSFGGYMYVGAGGPRIRGALGDASGGV